MELKHDENILALIARYLSGESDLSDNCKLQEWINASESNRQYFNQVKIIWDTSERVPGTDQIDSCSALEKVLIRVSSRTTKHSFWYYWQRIAAILILPLALGAISGIYFAIKKSTYENKPVYNEIYSIFGTRSALKLADGTLVWLNSGSSLKYPDKFSGKSREVYLNGEAYFEVSSDISRPFVVCTSALNITATGTKFNVMNFESDSLAEITLVSGKVSISRCEANKQFNVIAELKPNQHLVINKQTNTRELIEEDSYKFISWKDGKLVFRNDPLSYVVKEIEQIFNVDIEIQGETLEDYRYRATFQDESLDEILKLLKLSSPIDYMEVKRNPFPDGTFPRKKIIIFPIKNITNYKSNQ